MLLKDYLQTISSSRLLRWSLPEFGDIVNYKLFLEHMFSKNHYINSFSLLLTGFIGFLFTYKFASIYIGSPLLISTVYFIVFVLLIYTLGNLKDEKIKPFNRKIFIYFWGGLIILTFLIITFTPRIGEIGRYPAIVDWLYRFFNGDFPYNSPHTPSGFPFLFFFSLPFYAIGNVGYLELVGLIIFAALAIYYSTYAKENLLKFVMLFGSPVLWYFIFVRCELFTNMMLVLGVIFLIQKYGNPKKVNLKFILFAILSGLALSTRSVAALIYIIYFLYFFRNHIPNLFLFGIITLTIFISLLMPFYFWDAQSFLSNGPFAIQSFLSYVPMWFVALLLLVCIYVGWIVADLQEVFFTCGLMLFIPVFVSMMIKIFEFGFYQAMINDLFDLSYYEFALPFFILSIKKYKVDRFLGKIYSVPDIPADQITKI